MSTMNYVRVLNSTFNWFAAFALKWCCLWKISLLDLLLGLGNYFNLVGAWMFPVIVLDQCVVTDDLITRVKKNVLNFSQSWSFTGQSSKKMIFIYTVSEVNSVGVLFSCLKTWVCNKNYRKILYSRNHLYIQLKSIKIHFYTA